jgi:hypothetical protein
MPPFIIAAWHDSTLPLAWDYYDIMNENIYLCTDPHRQSASYEHTEQRADLAATDCLKCSRSIPLDKPRVERVNGTQAVVDELSNMSQVSIRNRTHELLERHPKTDR